MLPEIVCCSYLYLHQGKDTRCVGPLRKFPLSIHIYKYSHKLPFGYAYAHFFLYLFCPHVLEMQLTRCSSIASLSVPVALTVALWLHAPITLSH